MHWFVVTTSTHGVSVVVITVVARVVVVGTVGVVICVVNESELHPAVLVVPIISKLPYLSPTSIG